MGGLRGQEARRQEPPAVRQLLADHSPSKQKAKKALINEYAIYATSSIYTSNVLGVSLLGGNDSKFWYIKNNSENKIINRLDNDLKLC